MPHDEFLLTLADGTRLALCAGDEDAMRVVTFLAEAARLSPAPSPLPTGVRRLLGATDVGDVGQDGILSHKADVVCLLEPTDVRRPRLRRLDDAAPGVVTSVQEPITEEQWFWVQLVRLSACIARETHSRGGVLLHSGLAVGPPCPCGASPLEIGGGPRGGHGILLAGRSGVGKSTASMRLPPPWRSLADDVALVVRDEAPHTGGVYWAHPWPTWSRLLGPEAGDGSDTWDVQQAVPLRAIFVLEQGEEDRVEPMGPGHAVCLLAELAQQTSRYFTRGMSLDELGVFNFQRFENLCALARAVPTYLLHMRLDGSFWEEIERTIL